MDVAVDFKERTVFWIHGVPKQECEAGTVKITKLEGCPSCAPRIFIGAVEIVLMEV